MNTMDMTLVADVAAFLHEEAELLDDNLLDDWLARLDPGVRYVMPSTGIVRPPRSVEERTAKNAERWGVAHDGVEEPLQFWIYDEDYSSLNMRVRRLDTGLAHAELPESITTRYVTNVTARPDTEEDVVRVRSKILVHQVRHESNENSFYGSRWDKLRRTDDGFRLLRRHVELAHPVLPRTLSIFF
jgi:3-phenylpropionate/cinnamic acid dioxygenase small subunit